MLFKKSSDISSSEITDKKLYFTRRTFLAGATLTAGAAVVGGSKLLKHTASPDEKLQSMPAPEVVHAATGNLDVAKKTDYAAGVKPTPLKDITSYNNFYEFGTDKYSPAGESLKLRTRPWTVAVEGFVKKPKTYDIDSILKLAPLEERIYRHRCVEGWSMVIPWVGFSLGNWIRQLEPTSQAKYVEFTTLYDPKQMPGQRSDVLDWPYVEGLRLDEAQHPLTLLTVGLYGEVLPNQDGAPLRLVVPWKYGFKSIKSIVKIKFVEYEPHTAWNKAAPNEYGFFSNVNPEVDHPRWSQATERRIGEFFKRKTLMFNGYGDQVASLYTGMDLRKYF